MGCGYSKLTGSKKRGRLKARKDGQQQQQQQQQQLDGGRASASAGGDCDECGDEDDDDEIDICSDSSTDFEQSDSASDKYSRRLEEGIIASSPQIQRSKHVVDEITAAAAGRHRIANKIRPISGPMRPQINRSASQLSFFRMLDEKIANGKDLDDDDESVEVSSRRRNSSVVRQSAAGDSENDFTGCESKSNGDVRTGADDSYRESAADHEQQPTNGQVMVS